MAQSFEPSEKEVAFPIPHGIGLSYLIAALQLGHQKLLETQNFVIAARDFERIPFIGEASESMQALLDVIQAAQQEWIAEYQAYEQDQKEATLGVMVMKTKE